MLYCITCPDLRKSDKCDVSQWHEQCRWHPSSPESQPCAPVSALISRRPSHFEPNSLHRLPCRLGSSAPSRSNSSGSLASMARGQLVRTSSAGAAPWEDLGRHHAPHHTVETGRARFRRSVHSARPRHRCSGARTAGDVRRSRLARPPTERGGQLPLRNDGCATWAAQRHPNTDEEAETPLRTASTPSRQHHSEATARCLDAGSLRAEQKMHGNHARPLRVVGTVLVQALGSRHHLGNSPTQLPASLCDLVGGVRLLRRLPRDARTTARGGRLGFPRASTRGNG